MRRRGSGQSTVPAGTPAAVAPATASPAATSPAATGPAAASRGEAVAALVDRGAPALSDARYDGVAQAAAATVVDGYSTSFGWACRLLGRPVRSHVRNIYALVRIADEIVDGPGAALDPVRSAALLDALEVETRAAVAIGYSTNLVVHAFALTSRRFGLDPAYLDAFFASMRTDLTTTRHTAQSLDSYVYGSAEVVGLMCLQVFLGVEGRTDDLATLTPGARRLGAAFQKINFLRDLAADHDALGRTYFPGIEPGTLTDAQRDALVADVQADLDAAAEAVPLLPSSSRSAVAAAHGLFTELTRRIAATPARELASTRVRVPAAVKARILAAAVLTGGRS